MPAIVRREHASHRPLGSYVINGPAWMSVYGGGMAPVTSKRVYVPYAFNGQTLPSDEEVLKAVGSPKEGEVLVAYKMDPRTCTYYYGYLLCARELPVNLPEVLDIHDRHDQDRWYVRGHVDDATAVAAVADYLTYTVHEDSVEEWFGRTWPGSAWTCRSCGALALPTERRWPACPACGIATILPAIPRLLVSRHTYGRWTLGNDEHHRCFHESDKGRGAFPLTAVDDLDQIERDRAREAADKARRGSAEETIRGAFPEAVIAEVRNYDGDGKALVLFSLPEMTGLVSWAPSRAGHVSLMQDDLPTWERLYRGRLSTDSAAHSGALSVSWSTTRTPSPGPSSIRLDKKLG